MSSNFLFFSSSTVSTASSSSSSLATSLSSALSVSTQDGTPAGSNVIGVTKGRNSIFDCSFTIQEPFCPPKPLRQQTALPSPASNAMDVSGPGSESGCMEKPCGSVHSGAVVLHPQRRKAKTGLVVTIGASPASMREEFSDVFESEDDEKSDKPSPGDATDSFSPAETQSYPFPPPSNQPCHRSPLPLRSALRRPDVPSRNLHLSPTPSSSQSSSPLSSPSSTTSQLCAPPSIVRFDESPSPTILTWSQDDYPGRRGDPPKTRLSFTEAVEFREFKKGMEVWREEVEGRGRGMGTLKLPNHTEGGL
ncbi:hypothetical protein BT69DRAFT_1295144 [Atractiella rhizophila]|nr:hypothetical protein BT69DRAFT_1295144 [Atractiella rhizophila]